jgi:peptidoglycan/LPS O-acetylase OafA/YrhL
MSAGVWFWLILVISVIFGGFGWFGPAERRAWGWAGFGLVALILIALLGYRVFGPPVQ